MRQVYQSVTLLDLCGITINTRYQAKLNAYGIFTPIQFLDAPLQILKKQVFKSICGYYWYIRLRDWEIDAVDFCKLREGTGSDAFLLKAELTIKAFATF